MNALPRPPWRDRAQITARRRALSFALAVAVVTATLAPGDLAAQPGPDPALIEAILADPDNVAADPMPLSAGAAIEGARATVPESVRDVPVVSAGVQRTEAELAALERTILENRAIRDRAIADISRLEGARQGLRARYAAQRDRRRAASVDAERYRSELGQLAVASYVGVGNPAASFTTDAAEATQSGRQRVLVEAVDTTLRERLEAAEAARDAAGMQADQTRDELVEVLDELAATTRRRDAALAELAVAEPELPKAQERYHDYFMLAQVVGSDLTVVALHAYRSAADRMAQDQPACRLPWTILAGIGRIESRHGTYGGASLRPDGTTSRRIRGIALDGSPGIIAMPDTDGGAIDGDPVFDRAVGPMQFIPSTWRMVRRDGNDDGVMDPNNIYDAALAAGVYLCRNDARLDRAASLNQAILSYNRSQPYVDSVIAHHRAYQRMRLPG